MIRILCLTFGFVTATIALLWVVMAPPSDIGADTVARAETAPLFLRPALSDTVKAAPTRPMARPDLPEASGALTAKHGAATEPPEQMSYGIVHELQKPVAVEARMQASAVDDAGRLHLVQEGESLAGIAFRYFGTTIAYPRILAANPTLLTDPADLQAGMTLRIPEIR